MPSDFFADRLRRALTAYCHDGTEIHDTIDHALPGLENETAATRIKSAVEAKYRDTVALDIIIEIVAGLLEFEFREGGERRRTSFRHHTRNNSYE